MRIEIPSEKLFNDSPSGTKSLKAAQIHPSVAVFLNQLDVKNKNYIEAEKEIKLNPEDRPFEVVIMPRRPNLYGRTLGLDMKYFNTLEEAEKGYEDLITKWQSVLMNYPDEWA